MLLAVTTQAQYLVILKDEALNYQEKRMVTGIGYWDDDDFKPEPEYLKIFGTKIGGNRSLSHAAVWGDFMGVDLGTLSGDIRRNQRYKHGSDIRPLGPKGQETQRQLKLALMQKEAEEAKKHVDSIYSRTLADLSHYTHLTAKADPLYLLYYKRMLKPLENFPSTPHSYVDWGFKDQKAFENAKRTGQVYDLERKLATIKDTYHNALKLDMPRGKRFLMYHKALVGWREFKNALQAVHLSTQFFLESETMLRSGKEVIPIQKGYDDMQLIQNIMKKYKHKY